jgi:hypothetical protein
LKKYYEVAVGSHFHACDITTYFFRLACQVVRLPSGGPLIDCWDKSAPTATRVTSKVFASHESWKDETTISFTIRRWREVQDGQHHAQARVRVVMHPCSGVAKMFVTALDHTGKKAAKEYQPIPPQEYYLFRAS